ncbi:hypothetical protein [Marinisporobacter balticus]|uniref:DUF3828 domain-containing protein n=1 Tax=Marinisporobacter balticus TaxID=2018667 RepID=A0A4R2L2B6_9FIRM|nr:hypothetical protein [Marinisporobacter balticus]TCO79357.1 hypothetical protein EV214_10275 [Marinisporobacter balticus]
MKKNLLFFLILIAICIHGKGSFVDANPAIVEEVKLEKEKVMIEVLFKQRSKLWNNLYNKNMEKDQWMEQLKNIVREPLLSFDIEAFEEACEYPTDMDKVLDLKIIDIENIIYNGNVMEATTKICWTMQGLTAKYEEEIDYRVVLKEENNQWKIADYTICE